MASMWGRYANGRSLAPRVRGAMAVGKVGRGRDGVSGEGGKAPGAASSGATGIGHPSAPTRKASKYGNERLTVNGETFDSRREMERYFHLLVLQRAGHISQLERQVVFILAPAVVIGGRKRPPLKYVADFTYVERGAMVKTVEDVKGVVTKEYRIKRHLMAVMGFEIKETK